MLSLFFESSELRLRMAEAVLAAMQSATTEAEHRAALLQALSRYRLYLQKREEVEKILDLDIEDVKARAQ